jgi:uncharacterized surface protein with fasciclin (FAS1) repeats
MDQSKGTSATEATRNISAIPAKNVVDMATAAGNFTAFVSCLKTAGMTDAFTGKGPFTLLAPTDEAFRKLPAGALDALLKDSGKLKSVLNYHVISGARKANDVKSGEVMTLQGTTASFVATGTEVRINGARVTQRDIIASNGVIHAIDTVILPKDWQALAAAA